MPRETPQTQGDELLTGHPLDHARTLVEGSGGITIWLRAVDEAVSWLDPRRLTPERAPEGKRPTAGTVAGILRCYASHARRDGELRGLAWPAQSLLARYSKLTSARHVPRAIAVLRDEGWLRLPSEVGYPVQLDRVRWLGRWLPRSWVDTDRLIVTAAYDRATYEAARLEREYGQPSREQLALVDDLAQLLAGLTPAAPIAQPGLAPPYDPGSYGASPRDVGGATLDRADDDPGSPSASPRVGVGPTLDHANSGLNRVHTRAYTGGDHHVRTSAPDDLPRAALAREYSPAPSEQDYGDLWDDLGAASSRRLPAWESLGRWDRRHLLEEMTSLGIAGVEHVLIEAANCARKPYGPGLISEMLLQHRDHGCGHGWRPGDAPLLPGWDYPSGWIIEDHDA